ncbi:MAG: glycosyltransferase involved in cell wall biosynthesis [Psychroserpens sp.]|jgi:glycosyltransferase involved in cell wall biosynthesis|uniref:glycosyltransferase family 2 protein n=1 Tax=Psychroserpens sp. TaxID=2020870 RepID=UPI0039E6B896
MKTIDTSVIISTYNNPKWLQKVIWSFEQQTFKDFEVVIADDGSGPETKTLIEAMKIEVSFSIHHVWQEDKGFQKTSILNKAILIANADYLIFTDGDCVARHDFVETHCRMRRENCVLSGGYFKLSKMVSADISKQDIIDQKCFNPQWLLKRGLKRTFKIHKLTSFKTKAWFLNTFTPTKATFDGMNVSLWKKDILAVNGFDERMQYGGEDRELGERLIYNGITMIQARYSVICVHLYHERPYVNTEALSQNKLIRKETKRTKSKYTNYGIKK